MVIALKKHTLDWVDRAGENAWIWMHVKLNGFPPEIGRENP